MKILILRGISIFKDIYVRTMHAHSLDQGT
jgi:hypothetical protein